MMYPLIIRPEAEADIVAAKLLVFKPAAWIRR
jgi:hypothetical protein